MKTKLRKIPPLVFLTFLRHFKDIIYREIFSFSKRGHRTRSTVNELMRTKAMIRLNKKVLVVKIIRILSSSSSAEAGIQ